MNEVTITMSVTVGALGAALAKAQLAMRPAVKDSTNPHFKNRYASLASCVEALRPLHEQGIGVIQPPALAGPDGVCVSTLLVHSSGEWIRGDLYMPATKKDAQGFGSALTYARRYCLVSTVGLATDDDDGEATHHADERAPLQSQLEASVAWGAWEAGAANTLRGATTMGELQEAWAAVYETGTTSPNGTMRRLAGIKDARKAALTPAAPKSAPRASP